MISKCFGEVKFCNPNPPLVASPVLLYGSAYVILTLICSHYIKPPIQKDTGDILCIGKFWEASKK